MTNDLIYVCANCGEEYLKWQGRCSNCGEWNTLKDFKTSKKTKSISSKKAGEAVDLNKVVIKDFQRITTPMNEFNRVLGGGIVPGTVIILGGDPGIGKSTLLLQIVAKLENVLYIAGEESAEQIKIRFDRLNLQAKNLKIFAETNLNRILATIQNEKPDLVVVDSIQTVYLDDMPSTPGSIVQVRECALRLQNFSKTNRTAVILVGHVTKEGTVAGPRTLEHLVDVVLYLEGERFQEHRILRAVKNRFGATDEIGIFEMTEKGLKEVSNPSGLFLKEKLNNVAGSIVASTVEGSRALLVEVQALTTTTVFGYPQRRASGFDLNRLELLIAVMQKRAGLSLGNQDIFVNIVGGMKIKEPAVDLAVALAVASAYRAKPAASDLCVFGEVGLSGEIRHVNFENKRELEARRLGFSKFIKTKTINDAVRRYCV